MFLTEKKELDYATLLLDDSLTDDKKFEYVCHLFRLGKCDDLFVRYEKYKNIIESDYYLERIVRYCLSMKEDSSDSYEFLKYYFKVDKRFPKNHFSKQIKYLLKLRNFGKYDQVNYILDNQL